MTDYDAARANGVAFIGRVAPGTESPFPPNTAAIPDMQGFAGAAMRARGFGAPA
jgi:hypothetical protein